MLLRHADGRVEVRQDRHVEGLFPRETWLRLLADVGFDPIAIDDDPEGRVVVRRTPPAGLAGGGVEGDLVDVDDRLVPDLLVDLVRRLGCRGW